MDVPERSNWQSSAETDIWSSDWWHNSEAVCAAVSDAGTRTPPPPPPRAPTTHPGPPAPSPSSSPLGVSLPDSGDRVWCLRLDIKRSNLLAQNRKRVGEIKGIGALVSFAWKTARSLGTTPHPHPHPAPPRGILDVWDTLQLDIAGI